MCAGLATQSVPLYLSEIAPVKVRGSLNIMFQLSITIGILVAELINLGKGHLSSPPLSNYHLGVWPFSSAVEALMLANLLGLCVQHYAVLARHDEIQGKCTW